MGVFRPPAPLCHPLSSFGLGRGYCSQTSQNPGIATIGLTPPDDDDMKMMLKMDQDDTTVATILIAQHTLGLCHGNHLRGGDDVGRERHPAGAVQGRQADVLRQVRLKK